MTEISLVTIIHAPIQTCFDMARSVEAHLQSASGTSEKVMAGRTKGLFELNDEVTWEAKHFGFKQRLTVKITAMQEPYFFEILCSKVLLKVWCTAITLKRRMG